MIDNKLNSIMAKIVLLSITFIIVLNAVSILITKQN